MEDMQYEVSRWRPKLTPRFFALLDETIGTERFMESPNKDRLAELESLRAYLEASSINNTGITFFMETVMQEAVKVIDRAVNESASVGERLRKLLVAKDKKATILEMVAANEIDTLFIDFMNQNIEAAKAAKETEKAGYMEKLRDACKRYC